MFKILSCISAFLPANQSHIKLCQLWPLFRVTQVPQPINSIADPMGICQIGIKWLHTRVVRRFPLAHLITVTRCLLCVLLLAGLAACGGGAPGTLSEDGVYDPYETQNRKVHEFNRGLDRALVRPAAIGYSSILPDEIEDSIGNFASNLGEPSVMVNSVLQGDFRGAGLSTVRFLTNSTLGIFGLADVAREFNLPEHDTDFGETLYVWGAREGAYLELPVLGPSNAVSYTHLTLPTILLV